MMSAVARHIGQKAVSQSPDLIPNANCRQPYARGCISDEFGFICRVEFLGVSVVFSFWCMRAKPGWLAAKSYSNDLPYLHFSPT
jgi:hypothetical protein